MTRLHLHLVAALVVVAAPMASVRAQRATALAAGVTRAPVPRATSIATTAINVPVASGQDSKVMKGALIGAGLGAAIGVWAVAGKSTTSGPDHAADSDPRIILIPACAVVGGLLGVIVASRL